MHHKKQTTEHAENFSVISRNYGKEQNAYLSPTFYVLSFKIYKRFCALCGWVVESPGGYCLTLSKKSGIMVLRFHSVAGLSCNS